MILVTAAGGKTGTHIIDALRSRGETVRGLSRSGIINSVHQDGVEPVAGNMLDPEVLAHALDGVRAVVHIGPALHPQEVAMGQAVVDGMVASGVSRLILMSVYHPELEFLINHQTKLRIENYAVNAGLDYTILQPMHYMQTVDPAQVVKDGAFALPYSMATPLAFVDLADIAEVAARVLTEGGHIHATYPLCGTDLLSGHQVAERVAERSGTPVQSHELSISEFVAMISQHHPLPHYTVDSLYRLFTYYGLHGITGNANVLRWLLGREPTTFNEYVDRCINARAQ
jgi:uncharacterized protein YbjT (DUF2867 family)